MKKICLISGCSHAAGAEIDGNEESRYNRDNSFGAVLARMMGYEPVNIAISGSANSGIARSILRWFDEFYDPNEMEVFVVVGWTESSRLEVPANFPRDNPRLCYYNDNNTDIAWYDSSANYFHRINYGYPGSHDYEKDIIPIYQRFMAENELMLENWAASTVLLMQNFFKANNIRYVMCNTMHMFKESDFTNFLVDLIDDTYYYYPRSTQDQAFYWKYRNLGYENNKAKYWHHNEEPHRLYAEELYKFIGEQI